MGMGEIVLDWGRAMEARIAACAKRCRVEAHAPR
jgi:hypothetical protein